MSIVFYNTDDHKCIGFTKLVKGKGGVQANQFAISHGDAGMLLDPGGNLTYRTLLGEMAEYFLPSNLRYIFASHQDPDIVASVNGWLLITEADILVAEEWLRFIPHFCLKDITNGRLISIPYEGMEIELGGSPLQIIPAHYLHTVGMFQVYDPVSKILFSSDIGASLVSDDDAQKVWTDFDAFLHAGSGEAFHKHYMCGNKACRIWVDTVRGLDIEWMVPQHGASFKGKEMINTFLDWFEELECGVDLL